MTPHQVLSDSLSQRCPTSSRESSAITSPLLILDDHELFASALCITLGQCGLDAQQNKANSLVEIVSHAQRMRPALVILELNVRDDDGRLIDVAALIRSLGRFGCGVLVVSGGRDRQREAAAVAAGALGLIPKSASLSTLLDAVQRACAGQSVMPGEVRQAWLRFHDADQARESDRNRRLARLSGREREVLRLLTQGMRAADITEHFTVSITTVRTQIRAILAKLGVNSQLEAVALFSNRQPRP